MKKEKKEWTDGLGQFIAAVSVAYGFIKRIWSSMQIGVEIITWLKTDAGKKEAEVAVRLLGEKYLETIKEEIVKPNSKIYLHDLYPNEIIELGLDDGTKMLANAKDIFKAGTDSDFVNWGLSKKRFSKGKIKVRVCEMIKDATYGQLFGSLIGVSPDEFQSFDEFVEKYRENLCKLCVGQAQVEEFVIKHRDKLRKNGGTFFLLENEDTGEFFVASVDVRSVGRLLVLVYRFVYDSVWSAGSRHRFVVPQLAETL